MLATGVAFGYIYVKQGNFMEEKKQLTTEERRLQRIAQLKAKLQKEEARLADSERKKRTGQLVSFGVYIEEFFKGEPDSARERLEESIKKYLTGRNLMRALEGLKRLTKEIEEKKAQEKESEYKIEL